MGRQRNEQHTKQVETWKKKHSELSTEAMIQLLIKAIQAVRKRSLTTLSSITVTAVVERTLIECKEKFPELSEVVIDTTGLNFSKFENDIQNSNLSKAQESVQELLIDLLEVLGNITADILTKYLYQELMTVGSGDAISDVTKSRSIPTTSLSQKRGKK